MAKKPKIEINDEFAKALEHLENTNQSLFITGKAGTGKSTLLKYFYDKTKKNVAILAPTGVAALNVMGQTIHSFFRFPVQLTIDEIDDHIKKRFTKKFQSLIHNLDVIIIDEVSMVRADLMDCVDKALQYYLNNTKPFGGIQMVFIGDLYQLPPVVVGNIERELFKTYYDSPYFFSAKVIKDFDLKLIELEKIYRQNDNEFIGILNKIRNNSVEASDIKKLNERHDPNFDSEDDFYITLTTTNAAADQKNQEELEKLTTKIQTFYGEVKGEFTEKNLPTSLELELKIGSQIMLLNNDSTARWVNGSVGRIIDIVFDDFEGEDALKVELSGGEIVDVLPHKWDMYKYFMDEETKKLKSKSIGSYRQYPIRLAWAVTIHKAQGKTFDKVVVDIGNGAFAHGQVYVAISRASSFEGLILKKPILKKHIWMDRNIVQFLTDHQYNEANKLMPLEEKIRIIENSIDFEETLDILYLKANDEKSRRKIKVCRIGEMEYQGIRFIGMEAYCLERKAQRIFRVDRILEIIK